MSSVLVIKKSILPSLPKNVQKYVEEFFREQEILGVQCLVAQRHIYHPAGNSYIRWGDGMAPSHSVDLMRFGRSDAGHEVGEEIRIALKERPKDLFEAFVQMPVHSSIQCD